MSKTANITLFSLSPAAGNTIFPDKGNVTTALRFTANISADTLFLRFSNRYGKEEGLVGHTAAAVVRPGEAPEFREVTVGGRREIRIPAGGAIASDAVELRVKPGDEILVQVWCPQPPQTVCGDGCNTRLLQGEGDLCGTEAEIEPYSRDYIERTSQIPIQYVGYLCAVDAIGEAVPALTCLGDSITAQSLWVGPLTDRLFKALPGRVLVRNQGICGNRLVFDPPERCMFFGESGVKRLEPDILADLGTTHLIMALGGNDIGLSYPSPFFGDLGGLPTDEQFREACTDVVSRLHARGIRAYALSIYPGKWCRSDPKGAEAIRIRFNSILKDCFDGYIDVESALSEGYGYRPGYGLPDGIHLADAGGEAVADAVFAWLKENSDLAL